MFQTSIGQSALGDENFSREMSAISAQAESARYREVRIDFEQLKALSQYNAYCSHVGCDKLTFDIWRS